MKKEFGVVFLIFIVGIISIYPMLKVGFTTLDDANFHLEYTTSFNYLEKSINWVKAVGTRPLAIYLTKIPHLINEFWFWKSTQIAMFIISILSIAYFLKIVFQNRYIAYLYTLLFISFMQFTFQHNILFAYPLYFHFAITTIAFSGILLIKYFETKTIWRLILSITLYAIALMTYEMHLIYSILILFLTLKYKNKFGDILKTLSPYILITLLYIAIDFYFKFYLQSRTYSGTTIELNSIVDILRAILFYTSSSMPTFVAIFLEDINKIYLNKVVDINFTIEAIWIIKSLIVLGVSYYLLRELKDKLELKFIYYSLSISLFFIFAPNILISLTGKYQAWAKNYDFHYVTTHYSSIAMSIFIILFALFIIQKIKSRYYSIALLISISLFFGAISFATDFANSYTIRSLTLSSAKWRVIDSWTQTDSFKNLKNGSIVDGKSLWRHQYSIMRVPNNYWSKYVKNQTSKVINIRNRYLKSDKLLLFQNFETSNTILIFYSKKDKLATLISNENYRKYNIEIEYKNRKYTLSLNRVKSSLYTNSIDNVENIDKLKILNF